MEIAVLVLVVLVVGGVFAYRKVPAVKAKVDELLKKADKSPNQVILPPVDVFPPKPNPFRAYKEQDLQWADVVRIRMQQGLSATLTDAELKQAIEAGYDLAPKAPVQSVRDLSTHLTDTAVHGPWVLQDGQEMTLTGSGRVRIFGAAGTHLQAVNGVELGGMTGWYDADLPFTFSVRSVGGNIVAQKL